MSPITTLPLDLWSHIFNFMPTSDECSMRATCKGLFQASLTSRTLLYKKEIESLAPQIVTLSNPSDQHKIHDILQKSVLDVVTRPFPKNRSFEAEIALHTQFRELHCDVSSTAIKAIEYKWSQLETSLSTENPKLDEVLALMERHLTLLKFRPVSRDKLAIRLFNLAQRLNQMDIAEKYPQYVTLRDAQKNILKPILERHLEKKNLEATQAAQKIAFQCIKISGGHYLQSIMKSFIELNAFRHAKEAALLFGKHNPKLLEWTPFQELISTGDPEAFQIAVELMHHKPHAAFMAGRMKLFFETLLAKGATQKDLENFVQGFKKEDCRIAAQKFLENFMQLSLEQSKS